MLQTRRSRVRLPIRSFDFSICKMPLETVVNSVLQLLKVKVQSGGVTIRLLIFTAQAYIFE
jgi:hypothetical protein